MKTERKFAENHSFTGNDDLYPTEIVFPNGCKIRLACSEDGQVYLRVEDVSAFTERSTSLSRIK